MPVHDRLQYARQRAGLTGAQVKERTGIGESSLSELENGKRDPSISQLQALAEAYRRSIEFFLTDEPLTPDPVVLWRMRPDQNAEQIEMDFLRLCKQYHNLEVWCNEQAPIRLPPATGDATRFGYKEAEELAKRVRKELQLGDRPAQGLPSVLEEVCGVKVFHLDFEPSGTAASTVSDSFGVAVLLNAKNTRWRRNHDLAHELFHLLTWPIFHPTTQASPPPFIANEWEEKLATCFAVSLLLPADSFCSAINSRVQDGKISFESIYDVAREFDVSVDSVLWRMHFLYNRGPANSEQTKKDIERAKLYAHILEEREDHQPRPWPARYRALAIKALRRGEMATGRCAEYLGITRQEAMQFVEQEISDDEKVQVAAA
ncbi:MAG: XRE family transcriptional regulator [Phycisphaerales bacterium]|nr:XRE family transcriptional regulator [Phycisphaerales bacterium]